MSSLLPKNLKWLREFHGFTQQQLAEVCYIDRSTYSYYESGKTAPILKNLILLSRVLKVTLDDLLTVDISASPKKGTEKGTPRESNLFLSKAENQMLVLFRALDEDGQKEAIKTTKEILTKAH